MKNLVVMLTKFPEKWKVKTRLAKEIWFTKATLVQEKFIRHILKNNYFRKNYKYDFKICLKEKDKIDDFIKLFKVDRDDIFSPLWDDLWEVMKSIFEITLTKNPPLTRGGAQRAEGFSKVILVWSDIPLLNNIDFDKAFGKLEKRDIVLWKARITSYNVCYTKLLRQPIFTSYFTYMNKYSLFNTKSTGRNNTKNIRKKW